MALRLDAQYPFTGRWLVQNSPADRVPSHGVASFGSSYAIDFVPLGAASGTAPLTARSLVRREPPEAFPGYGRAVRAPVAGTVVAILASEPDHPAHRGLPSIPYALTQRRRMRAGWRALAGNHVLVETADAVVVALCHLQHASVVVRTGARVTAGQPIGRCGNSGNSTEPHVHVQAMDGPDPDRARGVPMRFAGALPHNGEVIDIPAP
jgi:hypothetical protein